jgi:hypothetical protein
VLALLEGGADINAQNTVSAMATSPPRLLLLNMWWELIVNVVQFGQTPLMIAAMTENIPLMFVLLAAGARVDLRDEVRSVLYWDISIVVTCFALCHRGCRAEGRSPITQRRRSWSTATVTSFGASTAVQSFSLLILVGTLLYCRFGRV